MDSEINYETFRRECVDNDSNQQRQGLDYFESQARRLYVTFLRAARLLSRGDSVLSVGAGSAYVEAQLSSRLGVDVTVADFPDAIASHRSHYNQYGIDTIRCDLSQPEPLSENMTFDLGMSCEVVEHIPEPPSRHLSKLRTALADDGQVLLTTPNISRLGNVLRLLAGESPLPDPERFFAPVTVENEGIHRREYTSEEVKTAMHRAGFTDVIVDYEWTSTFRRMYRVGGLRRLALASAEALIPRFKPLILAVGR